MPTLSGIVYRGSLSRQLTHSELDNNFNLLNTYLVEKNSDTGYAILPAGTTAERPLDATAGYFRYNTETSNLEGYYDIWRNFNERGYTGSINVGPQGFTGSKGASGAVGPRGFTGSTSNVRGYVGSIGAAGADGPMGFTGSQGNTGATGIPGNPGADSNDTGYQGSKGVVDTSIAALSQDYQKYTPAYTKLNINNKIYIVSRGYLKSIVSISDPNLSLNRNDHTIVGAKYIDFINGTSLICSVKTLSSTSMGFVPSAGCFNHFYDSSDYRLKTNLVKMENTISLLNNIPVYECNYIGNPKRFRSFLAHDIQKIFPHAVSGIKDEIDENGNPIYQTIDNSKLIPALIAGINELTEKLDKLKNDYNLYNNIT